MDIDSLFRTEVKNVESKLELPRKDTAFLKTAVAFANCQGGTFIFGIRNDDHAVVGMDDETLFQDMDTITNIVSDNCEPAILPNIYPVTYQEKSLIVVEISIGRQRPYYVKSLGMMEGTFFRVADSQESQAIDVGVASSNVGVERNDVGVGQDKYSVILSILREKPHTTAKELATQLHTTTRTTERILRQLKQCGRIKREGSDRYGHWVIL